MRSAFRNTKVSVNLIDGKGGTVTKNGVKRKYIQSDMRQRCDTILAVLERSDKPPTRPELFASLLAEGYSTNDLTSAFSKLIDFELVWYSGVECKIKFKKNARKVLSEII